MNTLYNVITKLQETQGTKAKLTILELNKNNELLKQFLKATYDPQINYYVSPKTISMFSTSELIEGSIILDVAGIQWCVDYLSKRNVTGNAAKEYIQGVLKELNKEDGELFKMMLSKDIKAGVDIKTINKVWPNLIFTAKYMRCSLMDEKTKERIKDKPAIVQTKMDGSFANLIIDENGKATLMTRAGNVYPSGLAHTLSNGVSMQSIVLTGELLVCVSFGKPLDRKTGNGILNSIMQGGELPDNHHILFTVWDCIELNDWKRGLSNVPYALRLKDAENAVRDAVFISIVDTYNVENIAEAYVIYQQQLTNGEEGCVLKSPDGIWKDGTSKQQIKMKLAVEVELEVYGVLEGTGKYKGMVGALQCRSSDGKIVVDVGTGLSDAQRKEEWKAGTIVTVAFNDIVSDKKTEQMSLFLPALIEKRFDKSVADSCNEIITQLNSAKGA